MRSRHVAGRLALLPLLAAMTLVVATAACTPGEGPLVPPFEPTRPDPQPTNEAPQSYYLPRNGQWKLPDDTPTGRTPSEQGSIEIEGLGDFTFVPQEIETLRPDIFQPGHFSVFDVVAHLADKGWFTLKYHYNPSLDTHVIDELDDCMNWWYRAHYAGGWPEINVFRMDMYPYKDGMTIRLCTQSEEYMGHIYSSFGEEIQRKSINLGRVVIPEVRVGTTVFTNVPVSAHNERADILQPGTITALDVLLSLADQGHLERLKLTWYWSIDDVDPADSYWVEQIATGDGVYDAEAAPERGGWVYESGSRQFSGFRGSHIDIPADVRVIVSPEYMTWYWLGSPM